MKYTFSQTDYHKRVRIHNNQLWAIVEGKPVDAGMIDACSGLCKMKNISNASAFAITLEKRGGSPTPNLEQLQVIGNVTG